MVERTGAFWGRRHGKALRLGQRGLIDTVLPALTVDLTQPPADPRRLFPVAVDDVWVESGFGGGEHLLALAAARPTLGLIGAEPFVNGMAKALARLDGSPLAERVRLHPADSVELLDWLPEASIGRFYLLYPDPWPKKRHWKRRFVSPVNLDRIARVLRPGGEFRFASDWAPYVDWTLRRLLDHPAFAWTARTADDWRRPWDGWPGTRYEEKALREGRTPAYVIARRL
ncbi:tRNA (guanosine(46)-N7)-methyltransferase TrmB [Siculibacillus lacustris]|uniref:tRNA (guanine-N(7)-)-methyltransferase n=1 Tax=Siculibacillus lacustris TaxID=1549641 RepID=A0A4Q9VM20_9HYPH|nr:tRNA (guanosine(46)-N7)-methyltransferase TrmB [Siculibacillus lacustris]